MTYHGKPNHSLPAKRYTMFIKAYEAEVTKAQEKIKKLDRLHRPYEIARMALEHANFPNDVKLEMDENGIFIRIHLTDADQRDFHDELMTEIGRELIAWKLHGDGIPATKDYSAIDFTYQWNLQTYEPMARIILTLDVPLAGTRWVEVTQTIVPHATPTYIAYRSRWRNEPKQLAPQIRKYGDETL